MTALEAARREIGTAESPPRSNSVKYNDWYYGRRVSGDGYPWCMAFVQWCFHAGGEPLPYKTASCSALLRWFRANAPQRVVSAPAAGDVAIFSFGHTGIVESWTDTTVTCIEGNTSRADAANGGEVMRATRPRSLVTAYIRWEEILTGEEIYRRLRDYLASKSAPEWAEAELEEAKRLGITDGTAPQMLASRAEAALMAKRAAESAR